MNKQKKRLRQEKAIERIENELKVYESISKASQKTLENTKAKLLK